MGSAAEPWFTVDENYRILDDTRHPLLRNHIGEILWDLFPAAESEFREIYERAWATGYATGLGFHAGILYRLNARLDGDWMRVVSEVVERLDVITLARLTTSLELIRVAVEDDRRSRTEAREPLRLVTRGD